MPGVHRALPGRSYFGGRPRQSKMPGAYAQKRAFARGVRRGCYRMRVLPDEGSLRVSESDEGFEKTSESVKKVGRALLIKCHEDGHSRLAIDSTSNMPASRKIFGEHDISGA